jgi:hypothetical protein
MRKFIFSLLFFSSLMADEVSESLSSPWMTGPLIAPSPLVVPVGHYDIEPYVIAIPRVGRYDSNWHSNDIPTFWNLSQETLFIFGLTEWMDVEIIPTFFLNMSQDASKWGFGDFPIMFDFQIYDHSKDLSKWSSNLKITIGEIFPTGKYQDLNPAKLGTDGIGAGSFQTLFALVWGNMFHLGKGYFLATRSFVQYNYEAPVYAKNLNVYAATTQKVYPPHTLQFDFSTEITLSKHWVFANDIYAVWNGKTRFKGGLSSLPSTFQLSLAPALEYNWNTNMGIIFGPWFTIAGRNAFNFTGAAIAFNYYK